MTFILTMCHISTYLWWFTHIWWSFWMFLVVLLQNMRIIYDLAIYFVSLVGTYVFWGCVFVLLPLWFIDHKNRCGWFCCSSQNGLVYHHQTCFILSTLRVGYLLLLYLRFHCLNKYASCFHTCVCCLFKWIYIPACGIWRACTIFYASCWRAKTLVFDGMWKWVCKKWAVPVTR